ncbi:MAG: uroporphyrinogen decarboxylase [Chloroflexota bacterium]|nr:MAG: uroporphyrinogen decarboxylase [Chloroflexota bacterium]
MKPMTKWERVEAALHGAEVDRVPFTFWRHYAVQEWSPKRLAELTLEQYRRFDLDLIKLTPTGIYPIQDWGPTIRFSRDDTVHPAWVEAAVTSADEWDTLPRLDVTTGALGRELEAIRYLMAGLDEDVPVVTTLYSPLTIAAMLCWTSASRDRIVHDLREAPQKVHAGLAVIREVVREYAAACLEAGVSGIFLATQMANFDTLTAAEYEEFGAAYDLPVLEAVLGKSRLTILHVCRQNIMFERMADYPVDALNWADRASSGPNLAQARQMTGKALAGGLAVETLRYGTEAEVTAEVRDAIEQTGGRGFILTPGCTIDARSPEANLQAARRAVESDV